MDSLDRSLLTLFSFIKFPFVSGETIEVETIINKLLDLDLFSKKEAAEILEVMKNPH